MDDQAAFDRRILVEIERETSVAGDRREYTESHTRYQTDLVFHDDELLVTQWAPEADPFTATGLRDSQSKYSRKADKDLRFGVYTGKSNRRPNTHMSLGMSDEIRDALSLRYNMHVSCLTEHQIRTKTVWNRCRSGNTFVNIWSDNSDSVTVFSHDSLRWAKIPDASHFRDLPSVVQRRLAADQYPILPMNGGCVLSRESWSAIKGILRQALSNLHIWNFEMLGCQSVDKKVLPSRVTVRRGVRRADPFDDEGIFGRRSELICKGVLQAFLVPLRVSYESGLKTVGGGILDYTGTLSYENVPLQISIDGPALQIRSFPNVVSRLQVLNIDFQKLLCVVKMQYRQEDRHFQWIAQLNLLEFFSHVRMTDNGTPFLEQPMDCLHEETGGLNGGQP